MFGPHSGQQGVGQGGINAQDFMLRDVDLDQFLDNYLVQLHSDNTNSQNVSQVRNVVSEMGSFGRGNAPGLGFPPLAQQGVMGYGGLGMPSLNLSTNNPLAGLALLQQHQQQQQQQQPMQSMQQMQPPMQSSVQFATAPSGSAMKAASAPKGRKGRAAAGKQTLKNEAVSSESESEEGSSDEEARDRKRQATAGMDEAERRHHALQEKNRRAQRRFRERQKNKLQDLHKQIDELTTKVSTLQSENTALHSRTSILEKVLDMRNEQIQVMQETKEATTGYPRCEEDLSSMEGFGGHLIQLTPETIKDLSSDQMYKIYQMYVKELSVRLMNRGPDGESDSMQEMENLVKDLSMMIMRLGVIKPLESRKFIVVSRQYLGSTEAEVIELWRNAMKSIDLTEQQKREVVELKRMFLQKIDPIMEERRLLNVQIQSNLPHDAFATKNALTYIKAHEAVIKLRDNLRAEQNVVLEFSIAVFRGVFKPWQMATLLVKCYPAVPDALGIASTLAMELGEPDHPHARQLTLQLGGYLERSVSRSGGPDAMPSTSNVLALSAGSGLGMDGSSGPSASMAARGIGGLNNMVGGLGEQQFGNRLLAPGLGEAFSGTTPGMLGPGSGGGFGTLGFHKEQ